MTTVLLAIPLFFFPLKAFKGLIFCLFHLIHGQIRLSFFLKKKIILQILLTCHFPQSCSFLFFTPFKELKDRNHEKKKQKQKERRT